MEIVLVPVCEHSKGSVSLYDGPHHADLLWPEELQRQSLTWHQHHGCVWQHRNGLTAVVIMDSPTVELLHVWTQILRYKWQCQHRTSMQKQWMAGCRYSLGIPYSMWRGQTGVKGDEIGLLCLFTVSVFSFHVVFLLLLLIVCHSTGNGYKEAKCQKSKEPDVEELSAETLDDAKGRKRKLKKWAGRDVSLVSLGRGEETWASC